MLKNQRKDTYQLRTREGVRELHFHPPLKLTLQHSRGLALLSHAGGEELWVRAYLLLRRRNARPAKPPTSSVMLAGSGINSCEKPILSIAMFQSLPKRISITPPLTTFGSNEKVFA